MNSYKQILQSIGWPTDILVLDFETYFDSGYSLRKMSTVEYVTDKRFEFLGLGLGNLEVKGINDHFIKFTDPDAIPLMLDCIDWKNRTTIIQNAKFDALILKLKFNIQPKYIIDILDLARHYDSRMKHDLASLAKMFKLKAKGNINQFKGLHYEQMSEEQKKALVDYTLGDIKIGTDLFKILLPLLSNPKVEIPIAKHTLSLYLNSKIVFDMAYAETLKCKMQNEMQRAINRTGLDKKTASGNKSFVKEMQRLLKDEPLPMKQGKNKRIPATAKNDEGMKILLNHKNELVRDLANARLAVKSWPLHIKRIENMERQAACRNSKLGMPLTYYGAHTGRWGGTEGINPQNFGGRGRGSETHPLIQSMRQLLIAPENYQFYIADFAQIEARVLAWLASQSDLVEGFKNGQDIYSEFATFLFGTLVRKPLDSDTSVEKRLHKIRRGFGKDAILGCGYGMGTNKFYDNCRKNIDLRPLFDSGEYDWDFIHKLIQTYRTKYIKIPAFWREIEKQFRIVTKYPGEKRSYYNSLLTPQTVEDSAPLLILWNSDNRTHIQLPSGRILYYRHAKVKDIVGRYSKTTSQIKYHWGYLWGGSLTENIVQAIARDIMAESILRLEAEGYKIVLHVHDELVILVPEKQATEFIGDCIINTMCENPNWASGLPIGAEGEYSERYKK